MSDEHNSFLNIDFKSDDESSYRRQYATALCFGVGEREAGDSQDILTLKKCDALFEVAFFYEVAV